MAPSLSACCLVVGWLPRHLLVGSPWKTESPSAARFQLLHEETPSLSSRHLALRRLPAGRPPMGRLSLCRLSPLTTGHCLNSTVSLLECTALFQMTLSASFSLECTRSLWWSNTLEYSISFSQRHLPRRCPFKSGIAEAMMTEASQVAYC